MEGNFRGSGDAKIKNLDVRSSSLLQPRKIMIVIPTLFYLVQYFLPHKFLGFLRNIDNAQILLLKLGSRESLKLDLIFKLSNFVLF